MTQLSVGSNIVFSRFFEGGLAFVQKQGGEIFRSTNEGRFVVE